MQSAFNIYKQLQENLSDTTDGFVVASLPNMKKHKIGVSVIGQPSFFIKCSNSEKSKLLDLNLEFISIQFNCECQLYSNKKVFNGIYSVISLKTDSIELQEYFINVVFLVLENLSAAPKLSELKIEIDKLINLFSKFSKPATKTIQGVWAELLVIEQSRNPAYLIRAWHNNSTDKFDFNDGSDKIEIKSTAKSRRLHNFSLEQLNPNTNSSLLIVSVLSVETGVGKSIFDIVKLIAKKIKDRKSLLRINEVLAQVLGNDFEKTFEVFFDYQLAIDTLKYYESFNIPKIDPQIISPAISNIHFDCDLTEVTEVKKLKTKSLLHKSLL